MFEKIKNIDPATKKLVVIAATTVVFHVAAAVVGKKITTHLEK